MSLPSIETPTYGVNLSGGLVKFRPYTVKEEKHLLMASQAEDPKEIFETTLALCQGCILDDIKVTDLPLFDLEKLLIATRSKSVGEEVKTSFRCPHCQKFTEVNINIENIETTQPEGLETTIMIDEKYGMKMRYPSVETTGASLIVEDDDIVGVLLSCIESVFDSETVYPLSDSPEEERREFIESLSVEHIRAITDKFLDKIPSNVVNINYTCPHCKEKVERKLDNLLDFFI